MNKRHLSKQSLLAARRWLLSAKALTTRCLIKGHRIRSIAVHVSVERQNKPGNKSISWMPVHQMGGGSGGKILTTNLFNRLILHLNPSLIPSLFHSGCLQTSVKGWGKEESKQRKRGIKSSGLNRGKEQRPDSKKGERCKRREREKTVVYGALWHAAISSLNLQCGLMDCERRRGKAIKWCRWELRTNWYDHNMSH